MVLRTQLRGRFLTSVSGAGFVRAGAAPTAADIPWLIAAVSTKLLAAPAPYHMPAATNKPAAIASTPRCVAAPPGRLLWRAAFRGTSSSSRSSAGRNANRGRRGAMFGACHSSQSTAAPRTFSQWKSGGMKPGSGMPGAATACGRAFTTVRLGARLHPRLGRRGGHSEWPQNRRFGSGISTQRISHRQPRLSGHRFHRGAWHPTVAGLRGRLWRGHPVQRFPETLLILAVSGEAEFAVPRRLKCIDIFTAIQAAHRLSRCMLA